LGKYFRIYRVDGRIKEKNRFSVFAMSSVHALAGYTVNPIFDLFNFLNRAFSIYFNLFSVVTMDSLDFAMLEPEESGKKKRKKPAPAQRGGRAAAPSSAPAAAAAPAPGGGRGRQPPRREPVKKNEGKPEEASKHAGADDVAAPRSEEAAHQEGPSPQNEPGDALSNFSRTAAYESRRGRGR
jgi:hypothetical protein